MPASLANAGERGLAEAHFEFVAKNEADDELAAVALRALAAGQGRRENVRGMRRILLPVNVVVIHATNHQRVGEGRRDGINLFPCADDRGRPATGSFVEDLQSNFDVVLLKAAKSATERVEEKAFGL